MTEPSREGARETSAVSQGDRRQAILAGAAALAALMVPAAAAAQGVRKKAPPVITPRPTSPADTFGAPLADPTATWAAPELRLARRITMGLTEADAALARQLGYDGYLEYQLNAPAIDDSAADAFVATQYILVGLSENDLYNHDFVSAYQHLTGSTIYRAAFSRRQLKERMVEFLTDHFNIYFDKVSYLKITDDRDVIRKYALSSFPELLYASAHSVAMLTYLDQTASTAGVPNQNYAREIMELHSLGVNGGYTQADVADLSRVFTGWTQAGKGTFAFNPVLHDFGAKTVVGVNIPASAPATGAAAVSEGEQIITALASRPSTAAFISTKLLRFFLRYDPSPAQVAAVANAYASTGGDIKAMLRVVLSRENVMTAPAKLKRPFHLTISGVRALGVQLADPLALVPQLTLAGHQPFFWLTPDGYPDSAEYWAGNMMPRWNIADFLSRANSAASLRFDVAPFMATPTPAAIVDAIDRACFCGEMSAALRDELVAYVGVGPTVEARVRETVSLALSSYEFQCY